jgi:hypothetical protein
VVAALSLSLLLFPLATNSFAWSGEYKENEIGDRQYIGTVMTRDNGDVHALGVGCTEGLFEIKIVSDSGPLDERDIRVRFDSKKVSFWSVSEGPSSNGLSSLEFSDPERLFSLIKKAKTMAVQFYTYSGAAITTKFSVKGASGILNKLKKAGCKL